MVRHLPVVGIFRAAPGMERVFHKAGRAAGISHIRVILNGIRVHKLRERTFGALPVERRRVSLRRW